jgi:hypothetical protein
MTIYPVSGLEYLERHTKEEESVLNIDYVSYILLIAKELQRISPEKQEIEDYKALETNLKMILEKMSLENHIFYDLV